ncbi:MAG: hypothetical protein OEM52_04780 [bacterium]|nr:hypothetical protein [bacterium]
MLVAIGGTIFIPISQQAGVLNVDLYTGITGLGRRRGIHLNWNHSHGNQNRPRAVSLQGDDFICQLKLLTSHNRFLLQKQSAT